MLKDFKMRYFVIKLNALKANCDGSLTEKHFTTLTDYAFDRERFSDVHWRTIVFYNINFIS